MLNPLTWLSRRRFPYEPLISIEISKNRLLHNLNEFRKLAPQSNIAPVLKSNAYGHGLIEIARILETARKENSDLAKDTPFFVIDSYFEALALRSKSIKTPLLIIGYNRPEILLNPNLKNVSYAITSIDTLQQIQQTKRSINIHLKIDTGMHRQGILPDEIKDALQIIKKNQKINLEGVCSHLSDADNIDPSFTKLQIETWNNIVDQITIEFPQIKYIHLSNTYGHKYSNLIKSNISRLGIGLYGIAGGFENILDLKPILQMKTIITGIKKIKKGQTVGYNNTFIAENDITIATLPIGYFEGLDRRLSDKGFFEVSGGRIICPIIGRISMNISTIDVSRVPNLKIGDGVVIISNNPISKNSIQSMAKITQTIPYEIVIYIPEHLRRVVVE